MSVQCRCEGDGWAIDWRDHLHSTYLHLVQATQRRLAAALLLALVSVPAVPAQTSPLQQVPAKAPIVIHLRGWERTVERLKATLTAAVPDYAPLLATEKGTTS